MLNAHSRNSAKGVATHEIAAQWLTTTHSPVAYPRGISAEWPPPTFTRVTATRLVTTVFQPRGLSLLHMDYSMNYSQVAYHAHRRHANSSETSITGMSAAWLILTTHELQPSGLSCLSASCQIAPMSITGISAAWLILTTQGIAITY